MPHRYGIHCTGRCRGGAVVAAGALVLGKTIIGPHEIWGGVPAKFIKKTNPDQAESYARHYVEYSKWYLKEDGEL